MVRTESATKQDSFVLSRPSLQFATVQSQILAYWGLLKTWKLETGSRQDKTRQSCLVRVGGVNKLYDKPVLCQNCLLTDPFGQRDMPAATLRNEKNNSTAVIMLATSGGINILNEHPSIGKNVKLEFPRYTKQI